MEDSIKKIFKINALYDLYGSLLSQRQSKVIEMYYEDNLSLLEISELENISKNAVYDALIKGEHLLLEYEEKLGLLKQENKLKEDLKRLYKEGHLDEEALKILKGDN